ncbi:50S ribosomal protein L21 [Parasutterella secunda]|uniref:50S ribosomal protein L21 n=1 Tax=Parasutterella secunda TaxID=626947 RepID=UPI0003377A1C|nr:50S ribosomal protein L21 [Parasutterella secunda]CDE75046.1 50S ribosomal protein L21 [Sutterella sp. CAG:521]HIR20976.1 50S ribosomal protein L21 [Candidatus Aphodousia faecalis]HJI94757.1 50S ribosomal protein L21 [Sutterellaceae bacterium]MCL1597095.1 50S ribosomal protein L21 [Parasutterella secunda]MCR8919968.1 50S ribosomal protein L21 [Parasutterella secunda]
MYAIIKTGGKQYRVAAGDTIKVETLNAEVGSQVTLSEVLAVSDGNELKVGAPFVEGASVTATVVSHGRHDKVRIFKMRRRKHSIKSAGHRQNYTELKIDSIAA